MRIYLDKQIFSHLFKQEKSEYIDLLKKMYEYKENGLFCFSHAHLLDLKNDKTEIKYHELNFMETIVDNNYLSYHAIDKYTSCYLAKPNQAFADIDIEDEEVDFTKIFDIDDSLLSFEDKVKFNTAKKNLTDFKFDFGIFQNNLVPQEVDETLKKIIPFGNSEISLLEMMENMMNSYKIIQEDKTVYKALRNISDKYINNGKFSVEYDKIDFNDELKNSVLQKTFIDYVKGNLNPNNDKNISNYDFYTNAYFTLDLLGISKEPSKSVKFTNVMNDGFHSYYAAYCDVVVSDDNGFLKKTKAMYRLLGIDTKVMHSDEFIKSFSFVIDNNEKNQDTFFSLLTNDLKNAIISNTKKSLRFNRETITIKPKHTYLGFFNRIDQMLEDNITYAYLYKEIKNYSSFTFYKEYEQIINKAVKLFGNDFNLKGQFNWEKEIKEINDKIWEGRLWDFGTFTILIDINKGTQEIGLLLTVK